jgi:very-short-patch-repair endonuclease
MRTDLPNPRSAAHFKSSHAQSLAKRLRRSMTRAEQMLWWELRRLRELGTHFRRQAPFGPYVVDFLCHGARLVIEVDGGVHDALGRQDEDAERQAWIESRGYKVIRFKNAQVQQDLGAVVRSIAVEMRSRKSNAAG